MPAVFSRTLLIAAVAVLAGLFWAGSGRAAIQRRFLVQSCTAHDAARLAGCDAYIAGVGDAVSDLEGGGALKREVCIPATEKVRGLRERVVGYLQSHPAGDGPAAASVLAALRQLYPC